MSTKSRIPILILKCASLVGRDTRDTICTACTVCIAACADRQMRDTPAWPLSSGTALQIMQRCIGSRGPYGGGVFISAVVIGARESTPCLPLLSSRSPASYNPFLFTSWCAYLSIALCRFSAVAKSRDAQCADCALCVARV